MPRPHPAGVPSAGRGAGPAAGEADRPHRRGSRISESCLRNWMAQADINDGAPAGLTSDERAELVKLRREKRVLEMEVEILKRPRPTSPGRTSSQNDLRLHRRALRRSAGRAVLPHDEGVHLRLLRLVAPAGEPVGEDARRRRARRPHRQDPRPVPRHLRRAAGDRRAAPRAGPHRQSQAGRPPDARARPAGHQPPPTHWAAPADAHRSAVGRSRAPPVPPRPPDRLWVQDVTQHPTGEGWVYLAVVIDAFSRRVVGWSIADHLRAELVVDALEMACLRRRPGDGDRTPTTAASTRHGCSGSGYAAPGCSARWAPSATPSTTPSPSRSSPHCSASCSTAATGRRRAELARAMFEWIEAFYNPTRRHSTLGYLSPIDYEAATPRHDQHTNPVRHPGELHEGSLPSFGQPEVVRSGVVVDVDRAVEATDLDEASNDW